MKNFTWILIFPVLVFCNATAVARTQAGPAVEVIEGNALALSMQEDVMCILSTDGTVTCETASHVEPFVPPDDLAPVESLAVGKAHVCVIEVGGNIRCFGNSGSNFYGQLDVPDAALPAIAIEAGEAHSCAINTQGTAVCWGLNANGRATPPADDTRYTAISTGEKHSCAVNVDGGLACWGADDAGVNRIPADLPPVQDVSASKDETCVLTRVGDIQCFNGGIVNQLAEVPSNGPYSSLSHAGGSGLGSIVCGLDAAGSADCVITPIGFIFDPNFEPLATDKLNAERRALAIAATALEAGSFISIETAFGFSPDFFNNSAGPDSFVVYGCGVRADGSIACWQAPEAIIISGEQMMPDFVLDVTAQAYSPTSIELFWETPSRIRVGSEPGLVYYEILRNGEFFTNAYGRSGYYDNSLDKDTDYTYEVRAVAGSGVRGELSTPVTVSADSRSGDATDPPAPEGYQPADRPFKPSNLQALVYGATTVELVWDRADFAAGLRGYEIWVNGDFFEITNGTSYLLRSLAPDTFYRFDVVAITKNDDIGGYSAVNVELGAPLQCI